MEKILEYKERNHISEDILFGRSSDTNTTKNEYLTLLFKILKTTKLTSRKCFAICTDRWRQGYDSISK